METENKPNHWSAAFQHAEKYAGLKYELYKYELIERAAHVGSSVTTSLVGTLALVLTFMMAILTGAFAIGEYSGHIYLGFAFAAAFFLLGFLIIVMRRRSIRKKMLDFYLRKAFEKDEN